MDKISPEVFFTIKSASTEPCKRTIYRGVKIFQITDSVLVAEREGCEQNKKKKNLSPSRVDITNDWLYTSNHPICLTGMAMDNVTFLFYLHQNRNCRYWQVTFWWRIFFQILAHPVFKMWVTQKPNKVALWNKRHFEEKKMEIIQHV